MPSMHRALDVSDNQKLSKKYHPDINPDEAAHEKFIEVSKGKHFIARMINLEQILILAYEVLSDSELKGIYDRGGEEGLKQHEARKAGGGNPNDLFSRFFGGGHSGGAQKGPGLLTNLQVELGDMYAGRTVEVSLCSIPSSSKRRGIDVSFKYRERSCVPTVTALALILTRIYMNVGTVMDKE